MTKTTSRTPSDDDEHIGESHEVTKKTRASKKRKTSVKPITVAPKIARDRVTLPIFQLVESNECTFQGNMPDPDNCQCNYANSFPP